MRRLRTRRSARWVMGLVLSNALCAMGCAGTQPLSPDLRAAIGDPSEARGSERHLIVGIEHLHAGALDEAGRAFNLGLETDPRHPHLNFLNGFVYDQQAADGESAKNDLAEIGYRLALRHDPEHWLAAYHLGRLYSRKQRMADARDAFAQALIARPDHGPSAYGLAVASYRLGDPRTAAAALDRLPPDARAHPEARRAAAMVNAALGRHAEAQAELAGYRSHAPDRAAAKAERRIESWRHLYAQHDTGMGMGSNDASQGMTSSDAAMDAPAHADPPPQVSEPEPEPEPEPPPRMVILDVVLLQQEMSRSSSHGLNLLAALKVQLGGTLVDATRSQSVDGRTGAVTNFQDDTRASMNISVPSLTYALNIANAQDSTSEVVSRPSVLAYDGQESEIFIGSELTYVASGVNSGQSYNKEVGVSLVATPRFEDDGRIRLDVRTEFTNFIPSAAPGSFSESVATTKSRTRVNAELHLGQTLALAAGSTTRETETHGGVPVLRDIPIIQYLFSTATRSRSDGALLILLTPRLAEPFDAQGEAKALSNALARSDDPRAAKAVEALEARYRHWFSPTSTSLKVMHALLDTDLSREFRRGDIAFSGIEGIEEAPNTTVRSRARRVLDDLVDLLYL